MKNLFVGLCLITALLAACRTDPNIPDTPAISFNTEIQPILTGSCGQPECHAKNGSEFSLIGYEDVITHGKVTKGDARGSELYKVVSNRSEEEMPPKPADPLDEQSIKMIFVWIEQGAKNN